MSKVYYAQKSLQWRGAVVNQGGVITARTKEEEKKAEAHKNLISEKEFLEAREASLIAQRTTAADKYKQEADKLKEEAEELRAELKEAKAAAKKVEVAKPKTGDK